MPLSGALIHGFQNEVVHCLPKEVSARNNTGFICLPNFSPKGIFPLPKKIIPSPKGIFDLSKETFSPPKISKRDYKLPVGNLTLEKGYT